MFCTNCGKEIEGRFCDYCGSDNGDVLLKREVKEKKAENTQLSGELFTPKQKEALQNWGRMRAQSEGNDISKPSVSSASPNKKIEIAEEYEPISIWGYFGYDLLFSIPIIGWIINVVFAFGLASNVNLKNYARSKFCVLIVYIVLFCLFFGGIAGLFTPR